MQIDKNRREGEKLIARACIILSAPTLPYSCRVYRFLGSSSRRDNRSEKKKQEEKKGEKTCAHARTFLLPLLSPSSAKARHYEQVSYAGSRWRGAPYAYTYAYIYTSISREGEREKCAVITGVAKWNLIAGSTFFARARRYYCYYVKYIVVNDSNGGNEKCALVC